MGRKKTHEEFIKDFMEKNSHAKDIEILGRYVNNKTKIKCKCKIDGYEWETKPNSLLSSNSGCPKCGYKKIKEKRTKVHEDFIQEFYKKNKNAENIEILGEYKGNKTKIKCRCKKDGYIWETTPNTLLKGSGCPKCFNNHRGDTIRKSYEEFLDKFKKQNKNAENIEILGKYEDTQTKIKCRCKIDGHEWETTPSILLRGSGCPKCYGNIKLTHEEFINRMKKINSDIEILGEYKNAHTKIKCKCKIDGYEWETKPNSLLSSNSGCPKCSGIIKKTTEEFIQEMKKINSDIEILGEYKNAHTKIKCKCKIDGYEWETKPNSLLSQKQGCPKCAGFNKTTEEFIQEIEEVNSDIEILGEYKGCNIKIKVCCKKDSYIWYARPNDLLSGYGCPKCNASKGEKRIAKYLDSKNIEYEEQYKFDDCKFKQKLPFDFYISSLNLCIEYDGIQHFEIIKHFGGLDGFIDTKIRDTVKTIYCKENNIKLIRIPYTEYDNIEKILEKELED